LTSSHRQKNKGQIQVLDKNQGSGIK